MRIKSIEFRNFRNFKDPGEIKCSTDGKFTIIYGHNGDGKTTLHQLFQWVFYGKVHFNKTSTGKLYNTEFEEQQTYGTVFDVMGRIDFVHDDKNYSLTRTATYKKGVKDSEKIAEELTLLKQDDDYNWKTIPNASETIEKLLPSSLAEYFFFDGENMIADLRVKGKDSAGKLKKTIYSMFDLDILESALTHIGRTDLKTTALGKLYLSKGRIASGSEISSKKTSIEDTQTLIANYTKEIETLDNEYTEKTKLLSSISEEIGGSKSKEEYETQRKSLKNQRDTFLNNAKKEQEHFGEEIMDMFPRLLISKAVKDAKDKIHLKIDDAKIPEGINTQLINYLLNPDTKTCICGNPLCEKEREHVAQIVKLLPPLSYASIYQNFTTKANQWGKGYNKEKIEDIIKRVLDNNGEASNCDKLIKKLDEEEKASHDIKDLIVARQEIEDRLNDITVEISSLKTEKEKRRILLKKFMNDFDKLTNDNKENKKIVHKIEILSEVADYFQKKLDNASENYSKILESNIQYLINKMLIGKRKVRVSKEFAVTIVDSHNDEYKSEGQFAVVSFAYIGGIFKMLKDEIELRAKEYPLVLDGPFSKLDPDQKQNVVDTLPSFAPQVIIFSKDDLHNVISQEHIGRVWTLKSNEEQNVATVEEGKLWK